MSAKQQLLEVKESLAKLDPNNRDNLVEIARLRTMEIELTNQVAVEEAREQEIQEKVEGDEITFNVQGVDFTKLPAEMIQLIDVVVRADRKRIYLEEAAKTDELTAKHKEELASANNQVAGYKYQADSLQEVIKNGKSANETLTRENGDLRDHITNINAENEDLQKKLSNCAVQLDENHKEIDRLNSQIDDYQKAQVYGERTAQKIIDVTPDETNAMQNLVNSISKKYIDIQPIGGNWHEAVAEDGSKTVVHTKDLPSLETQGNPFRDETNPALLTSIQFPSTETVENVGASFPQVQSPALPTVEVRGSQGHGSSSEMAEEERITRAVVEAIVEAKFAEYGLVKGQVV